MRISESVVSNILYVECYAGTFMHKNHYSKDAFGSFGSECLGVFEDHNLFFQIIFLSNSV